MIARFDKKICKRYAPVLVVVLAAVCIVLTGTKISQGKAARPDDSVATNQAEQRDRVGETVKNNLAVIISSPAVSSNPNDYISAHRQEYDEIVAGGQAALDYMLDSFKNGTEDGLEQWIMAKACSDILGDKNTVKQWATGRGWYNSYTADSGDGIEAYNVKGDNFEGHMLVVHDPTRIKTGFSSNLPREGSTTSSIAKSTNAVAAINAGGFTDDGSAVLGGKPDGLLMHEGKVVYSNGAENNDRISFVGFDSKGRLLTGMYTLKELQGLDAREGVSFGPVLVADGNPVNLNGDGGMGIAPRTAIGQKSDGSVLMLVIDGRSLKSIGASLKEVQDVMVRFGAVNAANLDGGSSSTMYYDGKIINNPSDAAGERLVPTAFLVEAR